MPGKALSQPHRHAFDPRASHSGYHAENFQDTAKAFLRSAKRSVRIEQQYIRGGR